jgi:hypothetical protein
LGLRQVKQKVGLDRSSEKLALARASLARREWECLWHNLNLGVVLEFEDARPRELDFHVVRPPSFIGWVERHSPRCWRELHRLGLVPKHLESAQAQGWALERVSVRLDG